MGLRKNHKLPKKKKRSAAPPNLKSASGSGFSFEDKVAAQLFCEMLLGKSSLGAKWGIIERVERQAADWGPFDDLLLTVPNHEGKLAKCGCSIKSNRQVNANGCSAELRDGFWAVFAKPVFDRQLDSLALFCANLSNDVSPGLNQLCRQAGEEERPRRLDEKITDQKHRKIYDSFRHPTDKGDTGLPWNILVRLIPREFDFENLSSHSEEAAVTLCRDILAPSDAGNNRQRELWKELLDIARDLRDVGGSVTRERVASKLRHKFRLRDDPSDVAAWSSIRRFSQEWMGQIETTLPGGLTLPRKAELDELRNNLVTNLACHVLGESGSGKSALMKALVTENAAAPSGAEIVWVKADQFTRLRATVPNFSAVLHRTRRPSALLVFDALDACYSDDALNSIGETITALSSDVASTWKVVLICQTPEWSRVFRRLVKTIPGHDALTKRVQCGDLSAEDMSLVFAASHSVRRFASQQRPTRLLSSPKMLDLLLRGQLQDNLTLAGEADFVDWWWDEQVKGGRQFAAEERIARNIAIRMAGELTTEVSPDEAEGPAESVECLIRKRVLRRTRDGRLRFDHDLLADWSRVMHLRSLGNGALAFMRANTENPSWLRAIRVLSQHLLERTPDIGRWRSVVAACSVSANGDEEPPAEDLQVMDAWLEGIAYCSDSPRVLNSVCTELFAQDGWLLRRFARRLLHTGTIPDPIIQHSFQQIDAGAAEAAAMRFRLPQPILWQTVLDFLIANPDQATDLMPVELAEIGAIWARLKEYLKLPWSELAGLVLLNGEKELRREVAGEYRPDHHSRSLGAGNRTRVSIYGTALQAASQLPDRAARLALKAAGRIPWDEGDVSENADGEWRGEWHDGPFGRSGKYAKRPLEPWPQGPTRRVSGDFFHAWFDDNSPLALYRLRPDAACEATLAFLIEWPKSEITRDRRRTGVDQPGFRFDAGRMYPTFWTRGPFLLFLRDNWRPALNLVIRLTDFATDRYEDWWPYQPSVAEVSITTSQGKFQWKGNHQVYAWNRYHMNTPQLVTCALMALEKWFDEQIAAKIAITDAVRLLYQQSRSLAFAGVLVSLGKRHPEKFVDDLKPLLFQPEIHMYDLQAVREHFSGVYRPRDGELINKLRSEWNQLPGRKKWLKEACCDWLMKKPELEKVLAEVSAVWHEEAGAFPEGSDARLMLLRWAADFDRSLRKGVTLPDGTKGWMYERPAELRDEETEQSQSLRNALLMLPMQCNDLLEKRPDMNDEQLEGIWQRLQNWVPYEQVGATAEKEDESAAEFLDHRHARSGLLAVLVCLGQRWLQRNPTRRTEAEGEIHKLLANPPKVVANTEADTHDDFEGFLARCVIQCWAASLGNSKWRGAAVGFVTAYRYRTVWHLFDEAFRLRAELHGGYRELESLALSFAVARCEATKPLFLRTRLELNRDAVRVWYEHWLPRFAQGNGPAWVSDWSTIEKQEEFSSKIDTSCGMGGARAEPNRRDYGLEMGVVLATFGHLPALAEAGGDAERVHWLGVCGQMVGAFCRTLPPSDSGDEEWRYEPWSADEQVFETAARRLFECSSKERLTLWQPILNLPQAAHHHISQFLNAVLLEALRTEPPRIADLIPIWREIVNHLLSSEKWTRERTRDTDEVWKTILLYGTPFPSTREPIFSPLVDDLRYDYERHIKTLVRDAHEQSSLASFLTTRAGERLLVDALVWLGSGWDIVSSCFWETVVERRHFERLLEHAWRQHHTAVRTNPDAFRAFKVLTLNLAVHHVPTALEIQQQIGTDGQ